LDVASTGLAFAGTVHTTTPLALFLMSLYVLGVPLTLVAMRRPLSARTWWGTLVITLGLFLVADLPSQVLAYSPVLLLLAAVALRSLVIVGVNDALKHLDPAQFAVYILGSGALVTLVAWVIVDPTSMAVSNYSSAFVAALFMYSMFVIALYTGINFFGQRYASAPTVAVLYSTEVVFAILLSATLPSLLVDRIHLTAAMGVGCALILAGAVFAEFDVRDVWRRRMRDVPG
jgi:drug/metabolite transporter (DMT)-like permease